MSYTEGLASIIHNPLYKPIERKRKRCPHCGEWFTPHNVKSRGTNAQRICRNPSCEDKRERKKNRGKPGGPKYPRRVREKEKITLEDVREWT
jgi:hypothetical protein